MKRWLVALMTVFLGAAITPVHGEYLILIANLGGTKPQVKPLDTSSTGGGGDQRSGPRLGSGGGLGQRGSRQGGQPSGVITVEEVDPTPIRAVAAVEYWYGSDSLQDALRSGAFPVVGHKFGASTLHGVSEVDLTLIVMPEEASKAPWITLERYYATERAKYPKEPTPADFDNLLKLASWALQHGKLTDFTNLMDELAKVRADHPVIKAYGKVQKALQVDLPENPEAASLARHPLFRAGGFKGVSRPKKHYTLLTYLDHPDSSPDVKSRVDKLEDVYRTFFYWFALQSKDGTLPFLMGKTDAAKQELVLPEQRQLALLTGNAKDFRQQVRILEPLPLPAADGYYWRRANLVVLSGLRLDDMYIPLLEISKPYGTTMKEQLLHSTSPIGDKRGKFPAGTQENYAGGMALLIKSLEEEAEIASISHLVPRQLLTATGLLPAGVAAPEWIQFGMGSFFETPLGAVWPSPTGLNPIYLANYKRWREEKKLDSPEVELRKIITDHYFRESVGGLDKVALGRARTVAWALTYWLCQGSYDNRNLDGLLRYFEELRRLPRDMEIDDRALERCFGRAFNLMSAVNPDEVDPAKFKNFAEAWDGSMSTPRLDEAGILDDMRRYATDPKAFLSKRPGN